MIKEQKNNKKFFHDFISTKIFQMFIQNSLLIDNGKKTYLVRATKDIFIFNIDDDTIEINSNKTNNENTDAGSYLKKNFEDFPKHIENLILNGLKSIQLNYKQAEQNYDKFNTNIRLKHLFVYVFFELLNDYKQYSGGGERYHPDH